MAPPTSPPVSSDHCPWSHLRARLSFLAAMPRGPDRGLQKADADARSSRGCESGVRVYARSGQALSGGDRSPVSPSGGRGWGLGWGADIQRKEGAQEEGRRDGWPLLSSHHPDPTPNPSLQHSIPTSSLTKDTSAPPQGKPSSVCT